MPDNGQLISHACRTQRLEHRWLLIIPAGTLNANRDDALQTFIRGKDANRDGITDLSGVTDIRLGLATYSHSGN